MKKFISKIKKVVVLIIGTIIALPSKIYAVLDDPITSLYGVYDPPNPLEECTIFYNTNYFINRYNSLFDKKENKYKE